MNKSLDGMATVDGAGAEFGSMADAEDESGTMANEEDDAEDSMVTRSTTATAQPLKMLAAGCGSCHIRCVPHPVRCTGS